MQTVEGTQTHGYWGTWMDYKVARAVSKEEDYCRCEYLKLWGIDITTSEFLEGRKEVMRRRRAELLVEPEACWFINNTYGRYF